MLINNSILKMFTKGGILLLSSSYTHIHHPHCCHGQIREKRCDLVAFCFNAAAAEGRRHTSLRRHTLPSQRWTFLHWCAHILHFAHTHVHTLLAKRCTLDEIVPMMDTLHSTVQSNTMNTQHITLHFTHYIVSRVLCKVQVSCAAHVAQVTQKTWAQLFLNVMLNTLVDHLLGSITMQLVPWR